MLFLMGGKNRMSDKGFYSWKIEKPKGKLWLYLIFIIFIVITFMLFNIWPIWIKLGLWYFSFYLLIIMVI